MLRIGKLPVERWKEYRDLRFEALKNDPAAFGSSVEEEERFAEDVWRRGIQNVLFALRDGEPIGMIVLVFNDRPKIKHVANIFGVYVKPAARGRGVGRKLLEHSLSLIRRKKGVMKVKLTVNPEQRAAVKMYQDAGFIVAGRMKKELRVGRRFYDELIMENIIQNYQALDSGNLERGEEGEADGSRD